MGKGADNRGGGISLAPPRLSDIRTADLRCQPPNHNNHSGSLRLDSTRSSSLSSYGSSLSQSAQHLPNAVHLNIYDVLTPEDPATIPRLNNILVHCGMGIFHTGVEVWGREFAFGGHPDDDSGIFEAPPRQCPAVRYRTSVLLGFTKVVEKDVEQILEFLGETEYVGNRYSLITRNCNTFSLHFTTLLGVQENFPTWVNRLAGIAVNVKCILPEDVVAPISDSVPTAVFKEPRKPPPVAHLS